MEFEINTAICRVCNIEKDLHTNFYKRTDRTYYTDSICKACRNRRRYPDAHTRRTGFELLPEETKSDIRTMLYLRKNDPTITYKKIVEKHNLQYYTFMYWIRNQKI